jgi:stearoyl-CoA desaturase (delta-9 desaturase)
MSLPEPSRTVGPKALPAAAILLAHLLPLTLLFTGVSGRDWLACGATCVVIIFAVGGGLHRYFAHRAFKMGRFTQFVWALIGTSAMQKGPLWWAGHHVTHHKYSDRDGDPHSPHVSGLYYAHIGWFTSDVRYNKIEPTNPVVRDFGKYPELRILNEHYWAPPAAIALGMYLYGGMQWLAWGFLLPTMTLAHATFCINTVNHLLGSRRFKTMDQSRNNVLTAIFAAGEGWHNNHHRYQRAARNGFYWWEFDPTYYVIAVMGWLGLAWDIQPVPERIYREAEEQTLAAPEPDLDPSAEPNAEAQA